MGGGCGVREIEESRRIPRFFDLSTWKNRVSLMNGKTGIGVSLGNEESRDLLWTHVLLSSLHRL